MGDATPQGRKARAAATRTGEDGRHSVVSLFSGCGGMDLGFVGGFPFAGKYYHRLPFKIVWANDINRAAAETYRKNLGREILVGDIASLTDTLPDEADVVIGGFPCQDISINGKKSAGAGKRTVLYRHMVEAVRRLRPKVFVAENVKGLLQSHGKALFERMLEDFRAAGYVVNFRLYLAADYGVPQMRERVFIVGAKGAKFEHPELRLAHVPVRDVLRDLEDRPEIPIFSHVWSKAVRSPEQGDRRLRGDRPATTIRAECHGNSQWHYKASRRISLREAARIQSFPDQFTFCGGMRETERQIGNAVPPVLAWHIGKAVKTRLESVKLRADTGCRKVRRDKPASDRRERMNASSATSRSSNGFCNDSADDYRLFGGTRQ